jgi:hypothetical protein
LLPKSRKAYKYWKRHEKVKPSGSEWLRSGVSPLPKAFLRVRVQCGPLSRVAEIHGLHVGRAPFLHIQERQLQSNLHRACEHMFYIIATLFVINTNEVKEGTVVNLEIAKKADFVNLNPVL